MPHAHKIIPAIFAALLLCVVSDNPAYARQEQPRPERHDVAIGGRTLHFEIRRGRADAPVIVLEAGATLDSREWGPVIERLAAQTDSSIVAYDRAGMGRSQPLNTTYDIREEVSRLRRGLRQLGFANNLVLAGHSYGGFLIQLYARLYPKEVAALIYVDANTVIGLDGIGGAERFRDSTLAAVRDGTNRFNDIRLAEGYVRTMKTMMEHPAPCGVPVVVLTQGAEDRKTTSPALKLWRDGHLELAARTGGKLIYAGKSGHMIPDDEPDLVAATIADLTRDLRKDRGRRPMPCRAGTGRYR